MIKGDSSEYNLLEKWSKNFDCQGYYSCEIGVREGQGSKIILDNVINNDIVFGIGPAGTGKTFLSMAFALSSLERDEVDRIILCRPAVEAGENLGFLPGDLKEKVDPYLSPLYDALDKMLPKNKLSVLIENKSIEIVCFWVKIRKHKTSND